MMPGKCYYIFLDEGGNFDFTVRGSAYYTFTSIAVTRPFPLASPLTELRHDLLESGVNLEEFHATVDKQATRDRVFAEIQKEIATIRTDSVVVEKCMTGPSLRPPEKFYPKMLGYLLRYVVTGLLSKGAERIIVVTDDLPVNSKKRAFEATIKTTLTAMLPAGARYEIMHHDSKSHPMLQAVDYINWAILRKWKDGDTRSYDLISSSIKSEFEIFRTGITKWY